MGDGGAVRVFEAEIQESSYICRVCRLVLGLRLRVSDRGLDTLERLPVRMLPNTKVAHCVLEIPHHELETCERGFQRIW